MKKNTLILTVGLPRSGKTTWARKQGYPIVSPDGIRMSLHGKSFYAAGEPKVWETVYTMMEALFLAGHDTVIVDATHITARRRRAYYYTIIDNLEIQAKVFDTSFVLCLERTQGSEELRRVIQRMHHNYEPVDEKAEGLKLI